MIHYSTLSHIVRRQYCHSDDDPQIDFYQNFYTMMIRRSAFIKISTQIAYSNYSLIITKNADKQKIRKQSADFKLRYRNEHNHSFRFQK